MPETRSLAIVGYGKMGQLIEQLAPEYGFAVALKLDEFNNAEFRRPHAGQFPRHRCGDRFFHSRRRPPKTWNASPRWASTWWSAPPAGSTQLEPSSPPWRMHGIGLVWSPNFSIGVNVVLPPGGGSRAPAGQRARIRRMGLGDSPRHEEGRAIRYAAEAGGRDEEGRLRAPHRRQPPTARARIPARTKSDSIPPPTPSRCATPRAAAKASRAAR